MTKRRRAGKKVSFEGMEEIEEVLAEILKTIKKYGVTDFN